MKYKVIRTDFGIGELEERVNKEIELGWIPQGGICSSNWGDENAKVCMCQAMVKNI